MSEFARSDASPQNVFWILALQVSAPPYPSLVSAPNPNFRWRDILTRYPVKDLAQLPPQSLDRAPKIQHEFQKAPLSPSQETENKRRQAVIKAAFVRCWTAYKVHAWKQDVLLPLSNSSKTTLGGWSLTLVSSLSTLWLLDLKDEFNDAVTAVSEINFTPKDVEINVAEVATHYFGGLLSAYDLTSCEEERLLYKAMELGDMLYAAFDTPNHLPIINWNPFKAANGTTQDTPENGAIEDLTSFILPFTRLSQLTGDMKYYDAVTRITTLLSSQQHATAIPDLWPSNINIRDANLTQNTIFTPHSTYATLLTAAQLLHSSPTSDHYKTIFSTALSALLPTLLFRPITPFNADILIPTTAYITPAHSLVRSHTVAFPSCALGATLALAAQVLHNATLLPYARRVTESCVWAHAAAPHALMPHAFTMLACASAAPANDAMNCTFDPDVWPKQAYPGFETVVDGRYSLGHEAVLSLSVMYRVTGEERWRDVGWNMFRAVEEGTRGEGRGGNAVVRDVMGGVLEREDEMPSEWLAATLKYFYLLFGERDVVSLDGWVVGEGGLVFRI